MVRAGKGGANGRWWDRGHGSYIVDGFGNARDAKQELTRLGLAVSGVVLVVVVVVVVAVAVVIAAAAAAVVVVVVVVGRGDCGPPRLCGWRPERCRRLR